ncbi:hypothetical protein DL768_004286 [Monosporascus sp. mg162]|nr:hypothetical protein DL768_004286 [Monosporascus sp. mg162]
MSSWMNDPSAVPNHNGSNGFSHMNDPNTIGAVPVSTGGMMDPSAFMANPGQFNPAAAGQFANPQQMAAAMQNGPMRNASPSFSNPVYQTNSVIPSKRPRPREDSIGASPRQNPGMLPTSRADTPQQSAFPGFQPNAMQQQQQQQNPSQPQHYPHLQPNGSATASPSPVMAGNQLRPGSVPQRVNTASPHPFSPASQQFNPQPSPVPSEHGGTPQPNPYMQAQNFPQNFNPGYAPSPSPGRPMPQNQMQQFMAAQQMGQQPQQRPQIHPNQMLTPQQMHQMQQMQQMQAAQGRGSMDQSNMMYQQFLQQKFQQGGMGNMPNMGNMANMGNMGNMANMQAAAQMQAQNMAQGRGMMPKQGVPMQNGQMPPNVMRPQQAPQVPRATNPEGFLKNLMAFMSAKQLPLDPNPIIEGRPIHLLQLFHTVSKYGYYQRATVNNNWPQVAMTLGFNPQQIPSAPAQVKAVYERNLLKFEEAWMSQQHVKQQGMPGMPGQVKPQRMGQIQPGHSMQPGQPPQIQQPHVQTPVKQMGHGMQHANANGYSTPQHPQMSQQAANSTQGHTRSSISKSIEGTPGPGDFPVASPGPAGKPGSISMQPPSNQQGDPAHANGAAGLPFPGPFSSDPEVYMPCSRELEPTFWGGLDLPSVIKLSNELDRWRPDVPQATELGLIDIHALTKSIQSGIHGEVRLALDNLASVTRAAEGIQPLTVDLRHCDELVESLLDCAEEQVDLLAEKAEPVSDEIDLSSYEDVVRIYRAESHYGLQNIPVFGDPEYELARAADRLIAITTILRNLSFHEENKPTLADESIIRFLCGVIRSLGTHENLLRSSKNCLDFMKDVVIILSNIAGEIELPGREQALCLLQFLLAFAPAPAPTVTTGKLVFSSFEPALHPYLPHAVDSLAKILARDEPNRTYFKMIFAADASASPPFELLTRTFALAISIVPDQNRESRPANLPSFIEVRKPLLMQGLLAADIIAQFAPGHETGVARCWLSSAEGFAQNLFRLIRTLCTQADAAARPIPNNRAQARANDEHFEDLRWMISCGVSTLKRLGEKARDPNDPSSHPFPALPIRDSLFTALQTLKYEKTRNVLQPLSTLSGLDV